MNPTRTISTDEFLWRDNWGIAKPGIVMTRDQWIVLESPRTGNRVHFEIRREYAPHDGAFETSPKPKSVRAHFAHYETVIVLESTNLQVTSPALIEIPLQHQFPKKIVRRKSSTAL